MRKLSYTPRARRDLRAIARYIADESGSRDAAASFTRQLDQKCVQLASMLPLMGRPREDLGAGLRSVAAGHYMIFLRYLGETNETLEIVRIIEGHRLMEVQFAPTTKTNDGEQGE